MGGFLGIGGSSAKTDRNQTLTGYGELGNVFNYAMPQAEIGMGAGQQALGQAGDYWSKLLSGNRTAITQAEAPEISAVNQAQDATRGNIAASGTARGGGLASIEQQAHDAGQAQINNSILGARSAAAKGEANVGQSEMADALNTLGLGEYSAKDLTALSIASRPTSQKINSQAISNVLGGVGTVASLFGL